MLVCALLAAAAFIAYIAQMNWKQAAEEVSQLPPPWDTVTWPTRWSDCSSEMPRAHRASAAMTYGVTEGQPQRQHLLLSLQLDPR